MKFLSKKIASYYAPGQIQEMMPYTVGDTVRVTGFTRTFYFSGIEIPLLNVTQAQRSAEYKIVSIELPYSAPIYYKSYEYLSNHIYNIYDYCTGLHYILADTKTGTEYKACLSELELKDANDSSENTIPMDIKDGLIFVLCFVGVILCLCSLLCGWGEYKEAFRHISTGALNFVTRFFNIPVDKSVDYFSDFNFYRNLWQIYGGYSLMYFSGFLMLVVGSRFNHMRLNARLCRKFKKDWEDKGLI